MNALERFEELARRARREAVPSLDVGGRVIASLRQAEPVAASAPMFAFAGLSLAAASVMVALAVNALMTIADPLGSLFYSVTLVIQ